MAKQSSDESEPESEPEIKEDKSKTKDDPSVSNENPPNDNETEEQNEIKPDEAGETEASVYTEQDLTEEGVIGKVLNPANLYFFYCQL